MSGVFNNTYHYYNGVGTSGNNSNLPNQTVPESRKNKRWWMNNLDRLEHIGLSQIASNSEFREYYRMVEGRVVYADFEAPPEILRDIKDLRAEMDIPTFIRHYDIIGLFSNQLVGELENQKDKVRIDSIDEFSENDYIREKTVQLQEYSQQAFDIELKRLLVLKGINPDAENFQSPEEQQQYLQFLEAEKNKVLPLAERQKNLNKNFKLKAVEWGEHTIEADYMTWRIDDMEEKEFTDYILTGRFFTHFEVGYDYYRPERWDPVNTFFSQEVDIQNPQDAEYIGRIHYMTSSQILNRWGSKLTEKIQVQLSKTYDSGEISETAKGGLLDRASKQRLVENSVVPFEGYYDYDLALQFQDALDTPLGERTYTGKDGEETTAPVWLTDLNQNNYRLGSRFARYMREDIDVRSDLFRVTEAYWIGRKRVGCLRYRSPLGILTDEIVTDDLLPEFIKENNIKISKVVSLEDFEKSSEENVLAYTYIPVAMKGKKISAAGSFLNEDVYFDTGELEYQIKGDNGNIYDIKLPVAGIITNSIARKVRPYQIGYNICMNQIFNLLEKEIGMFFLMDISFLPSEWRDLGDSGEILEELRNFAKDVGMIPTETSKIKAMQGGNPQMNALQTYEISYDAQISRRVQLADYYKNKALEQIGISEQRRGSASEYTSVEGIKQGVDASYAQTKSIFTNYNNARIKKMDIHLAVAQYCQGTGKDVTTYYRKSDGDLQYLNFQDPLFPLRQLGVKPISDPKSKRDLEMFRNQLLQNNTMGSDLLDYAELFTSDNFIELVDIGRRNRTRVEQQEQQRMQHESELVQKQIDSEEAKWTVEMENENDQREKDRINRLNVERIQAIGRAGDNDAQQQVLDYINKSADREVEKQRTDGDNSIKRDTLSFKENQHQDNMRLREKEIQAKLETLRMKKKEIEAKKYTSTINKN